MDRRGKFDSISTISKYFEMYLNVFELYFQLEKYMTEEFLNDAFSLMGEDSVESIKVSFLIRNA